MVKAIKKVSLVNKDIIFLMVGNGDLMEETQNLAAKLGVSNQIIFSDGVVLDVGNEFCVTYNSTIIPIFDIVPNISLIRYTDLNGGNSCKECKDNHCYPVTYFIRCCNNCSILKFPPIECFFGVNYCSNHVNWQHHITRCFYAT